MVTRPPRLAEWLVGQTTPPEMREALLGDLCEEFVFRGSQWYWRQALASASHWLPTSVLFLLPGYFLPLWLLDRLWSFVLSNIPLKEAAIRDWPMLTVNLVVACVLGAASRLPASAVFAVSLALLIVTPASLPLDYCSLFLVLPALASQWPARKVKHT